MKIQCKPYKDYILTKKYIFTKRVYLDKVGYILKGEIVRFLKLCIENTRDAVLKSHLKIPVLLRHLFKTVFSICFPSGQ